MAKVNPDVQRSSYNAFEKFLYLFFIPVVFTSILTVVLLSVFDYNVMNSFLSAANKIPYVGEAIPDPAMSAEKQAEKAASELNIAEAREQLQRLEADIVLKQQQLSQERTANEALKQQIASLESEIASLKEQLGVQTQTKEEYREKIQNLALVYARMDAENAAPILENLTLSERVLVLNAMDPNAKIQILQEMNPQLAAEASIMLKDIDNVDDLQISALQERLRQASIQLEGPQRLTDEELAGTLAGMDAASAALLLLEMAKDQEDRAVDILAAINVQARSQVLAAMAAESGESAARLLSRLGESRQ